VSNIFHTLPHPLQGEQYSESLLALENKTFGQLAKKKKLGCFKNFLHPSHCFLGFLLAVTGLELGTSCLLGSTVPLELHLQLITVCLSLLLPMQYSKVECLSGCGLGLVLAD
jgi:hypothetical protein